MGRTLKRDCKLPLRGREPLFTASSTFITTSIKYSEPSRSCLTTHPHSDTTLAAASCALPPSSPALVASSATCRGSRTQTLTHRPTCKKK